MKRSKLSTAFAALVSNRFGRLLAIVPLAAASACATLRVGADHEPGVRFERYTTFDWGARDPLPTGDSRLDNNPFFDSRVRSAVELELAAKGLRRVTESPDLLVHYHASVRQRVDVIKSDEALGYSYPDYGQSATLIEFEEGTLLLDVAEAKSKRILWRGWARSDVGGAIENPREMEKRIEQAVRRMMELFPRTS